MYIEQRYTNFGSSTDSRLYHMTDLSSLAFAIFWVMPAEGRFTVDWPLTVCRDYTRAPNPPIVPGFGFITTVATVSECLDLQSSC